MWEPGYLASLGPLQGALSNMGATICLQKVSVAPEEVKEWSLTHAERMVDLVSIQLSRLDDAGFFLLLAQLPGLAVSLEALGAPPHKWPRARAVKDMLSSLGPIAELLSRLDPPKVHETFWRLRTLLAGWDGSRTVELLCRVQEALEAVQPQRVHGCLLELSDLLEAQFKRLARLGSRRPFAGLPQGPPALLRKLWSVRETLRPVLALQRGYSLQGLQKVLEVLDEVQAIVPHPSDLED